MKLINKTASEEATEALAFFAKKYPTWDAIHRALHARDQEVIDRFNALVESLCKEQQSLCCYCEREIGTGGGESHIEHVRPRSKFPRETFNYGNLACSCDGRARPDNHCGHLKAGDFDESLFVSPSDPGISGLFSYTPEGGILSADSSREAHAEHMITELGLRCSRLVGMRGGHGRSLVEVIDAFMQDGDANNNIIEFSKAYVELRDDGSLHPFFTLSCQIFGPFLSSSNQAESST